MKFPICILIPAYNPTDALVVLINELIESNIINIVIVNDGSDPDYQWIFHTIESRHGVTILEHATNLGKGAALKTGLNHIYVYYPDCQGVITADADGQHLLKDILNVGQSLQKTPSDLMIGVRQFKQDVPFRSRLGNIITRKLYRFIVGQKLSDTQSGLRGIPRESIPKLLKINANGYEFELDMLLSCKMTKQAVHEIPIDTVYINDNSSSHFNPIVDSLKIYFVLFRSMLLSLATSVVDYIVFFISHLLGLGILPSQSLARCVAVLFNYPLAKKVVFVYSEDDFYTFFKYLLLVVVSGSLSYGIISFLVYNFSMNVALAKMISELTIYLGNFTIQRDFIFSKRLND